MDIVLCKTNQKKKEKQSNLPMKNRKKIRQKLWNIVGLDIQLFLQIHARIVSNYRMPLNYLF